MVKYGAHTLTVIIPYFGYSTMERATKRGEVVTAKTNARLLSSIPNSHRNRFVFLDLHTDGIPHYFEGDAIVEHLSCKEIIKNIAKEMGGDDFVFASTDAGRAKTIEKLANEMNVDAAFVFKKRLSGNETAVQYVNADVKGRKVVIYDDMIRTGGSLINAGKAYKEAGAKEVYAIATHGVLPGMSAKNIFDSGVFEYVAVTNSHPHAELVASSPEIENLQVKSIAKIVYGKILNVFI